MKKQSLNLNRLALVVGLSLVGCLSLSSFYTANYIRALTNQILTAIPSSEALTQWMTVH